MSYYSQKRGRSAGASARFKKRKIAPRYGRKVRRKAANIRRRLPRSFRRKSSFRSARANAVKVLNLVGENKYRGYNSKEEVPAECLVPQPKHGGTQPISYIYQNAGENLSVANQGPYWKSMNAYYYPVGDTKTERDGDFLFVKGTNVTINIQMLGGTNSGTSGAAENQGLNAPVLFRFMAIKGNRKNNPLGISPSVLKELFIDIQNTRYGTDDTSKSPFEYFQNPINKRQFHVIKDTKFILQPPAVDYNDQSTGSSIQASTGRHPAYKNFKMWLPCNQKVHFNASNQPDNFDTQTMFILQAVSTGFNLATSSTPSEIGLPRNYVMNVLSTTTALDS